MAWHSAGVGCIHNRLHAALLLTRVPCLTERFRVLRRRAELLDGVFAAVESEPFKLIVCLRLSPLLPSTLNSYLLGLTAVPLRTYIAASLVIGIEAAAHARRAAESNSRAERMERRASAHPRLCALVAVTRTSYVHV